jgi:hypothetical protein
MPLTLHYRHDWRLAAMHFRIGGGPARVGQAAKEHRIRQLFWLSQLVVVVAIAAFLRWWIVAVPVLVIAAAVAVHWLALLRLGRKALFVLRADWRALPQKSLSLELSDQGLKESDEGVISLVPWPAVRSYWVFRRVICIELANGLTAQIPMQTLEDEAHQIPRLLAELANRGVQQREMKPTSI